MENNKRWLRCLAAAGVLAVGFIAAYPVVKDRIHGGRMKEVSLSELQSTAGGEETGGGVKGSEETKAGSPAGEGGKRKAGVTEGTETSPEKGETDREELPQILLAIEGQEDLKVSLWRNREGEGYFFLPGFARGRGMILESVEGGSILMENTEIYEGDLLKDISEEETCQLTVADKDENMIWKGEVHFLYSSELPVLSLSTASGDMVLIDADKENAEQGHVVLFDRNGEQLYAGDVESIRGRGNSTWGLSKKPYQFKLKKKADFFGFGEARSFNLLANGYDETRLRNRIILGLAEELDMAYVPGHQMLDLYINDIYYGNYYLTEKVRVDEEGVAIRDMEKLLDAAYRPEEKERLVRSQNEEKTRKWVETEYEEEDLTGGYLFERELLSRYEEEISGFMVRQGDCYAIQSPLYASEKQVNYIADLMQEFQDAVEEKDGIHPVSGKHYSEYIDVTSFIQKYLIEEVSKNYDGGVTSSFFYKPQDSVSSKIFAGPVWDYDVAFGNCNLDWVASDPEGITKLNNHVYGTELFARLYEKEAFYDRMRGMYQEKVLPYLDSLLEEGIDQMVQESRASAAMDSIRWEELENRYQYYEKYDNDIRYLKYFIARRKEYLNKVWLEEKVIHDVTFMVDEEIWQIVHVEDGELPETEPVPVRYSTPSLFMGWNTEQGVPYDRYKPVYEDMVFHAAWQELPAENRDSDAGGTG